MKNTLLTLLTMLALGLVVTSCEQADEITPNGQTTASKVTPTGAPEVVDRSFWVTIREDPYFPITNTDYKVEIVNINPGEEGVTVISRFDNHGITPAHVRQSPNDKFIGVTVVPTLEYMTYISGFYDVWSDPLHPSSHDDTYRYNARMHEGSPSNIDPVFTSAGTSRPACQWSVMHVGVYVSDNALNKVECSIAGSFYKPYYKSSGMGLFLAYCTDNLIQTNVIKTEEITFTVKNTYNQTQTYNISSPFLNQSVTLAPGNSERFFFSIANARGRLGVITVN